MKGPAMLFKLFKKIKQNMQIAYNFRSPSNAPISQILLNPRAASMLHSFRTVSRTWVNLRRSCLVCRSRSHPIQLRQGTRFLHVVIVLF